MVFVPIVCIVVALSRQRQLLARAIITHGEWSLRRLRRFPFDKLKIDKSFAFSIDKTADATAILHAVSLGHRLGRKFAAEGVETAKQHLVLRCARGLNCHQSILMPIAVTIGRQRASSEST